MLTYTLKYTGWEITEKGHILFSEIKTLTEALAITKVYGLVLIEFNELSNRKVA